MMTTHSIHRLAAAGLVSLLLGGCYTADFDPFLGGVYVCDPDEEVGAIECPDGMACVNHRCENEEDLPTLTILKPELNESFFTGAPDFPIGPEPEPEVINLSLQGDFELVPDTGGDHVFGEGHVVVTVDGEEQAVVEEGSLSASVFVPITVENVVGPHRISAQMVRNDGEAYDHAGGKATRLFWIESSPMTMRPFVAILSPWPGDEFTADDTEIEVVLATKNFTLQEAEGGPEQGAGHVHLYYEADFPDCFDDALCDGAYLAAPKTSEATMPLPATTAEFVTITAVGRHNNHDPYFVPFLCDRLLDPDNCKSMIDEVVLQRGD